jgi:Flp pilus assembly protein TadG
MLSLHGARPPGPRARLAARGSVAVEAALVTPLVMALFLGIIELGFVFKDYLAAAGAVRSAVRIASATPRSSTYAQVAADRVVVTGAAMNFSDVQQLWVYRAGIGTDKPDGFSDFSNCTVCVKFSWDSGTKSFVPTSENWPADTQNACSSSSAAGPPDRIGVYLQLRHQPFTGMVLQNAITVSEASISSFEPISFQKVCG